MSGLLKLVPEFHPRVWGGHQLCKGEQPIGEAWMAYGGSRIEGTRKTLSEEDPDCSLLIKILDCHDWLSLQVHPNDAQARQLENQPRGKTEAWHILKAEPNAQLIAGVRSGVTFNDIQQALPHSAVLDLVQFHSAQSGETFFIPAGTLHALGPGLLIYEVQQASDTTYRVFDWDRPLAAGRSLHIDASLAVIDVGHTVVPVTQPVGNRVTLVKCPYFTLERIENTGSADVHKRTRMEILTAIAGEIHVACGEQSCVLRPFETVYVGENISHYTLSGEGTVLSASVPSGER